MSEKVIITGGRTFGKTALVQEVIKASGHVKRVIHFEDHGQDFLRWGIDEHGNVLTCEPYQLWVWKNMRVCLDTLEAGELLTYYNKKTGKFATIKYPVKNIEEA